MRRVVRLAAVAALVALAAPALRADVKTQEKTRVTLEGLVGGMVRMFGGSAARDGITSTTAVKGNRKSSIADNSGQIIDLTEQKVYTLDLKKKEYTIMTFAQMRAEYGKARAEAQRRIQEMKPEERAQVEDSGMQIEWDIDVKETGQRKSLAGYDTREVIVTIAARDYGKTLEQGGGFVLTKAMWLGPKIPALDELTAFQFKFVRAVYGDQFEADMPQMGTMMAMYPSFQAMAGFMRNESRKLQGTALSSTTTFETVRSGEQMAQIGSQQETSAQQRSQVMTTVHDILSVSASADDADTALPVGFKEKK